MNSARISNYRMAAYAAFAVGLINLRYQTGVTYNVAQSAALVIPGAILFTLTFLTFGKKILASHTAAIVVSVVGVGLLAYSFLL